jgi:hypothetical protein
MAARNYFSHTSPDGVSANQNVRNSGYELPSFYPENGNQLESLAVGPDYTKAKHVVQAWYDSPHHKDHVYGKNDFFRTQTCIGIGQALSPEDKKLYFVFISCPCV